MSSLGQSVGADSLQVGAVARRERGIVPFFLLLHEQSMVRSSNSLIHRLENAAQTGSETAVLAGSMLRQKHVDANVTHLFFNCR